MYDKRLFVCVGLLTTTLSVPSFGWAQQTATYDTKGSIYSCKDGAGRTITSDRPIPECAQLPMRELRKDGATRRQIDPPLTRSEREALAQQRSRERADALVRRQEVTRDRALLQAFPNMSALAEHRDRQIADIQAQIDQTYQRMVMLHRELQAAQAAERAYPPGRAPGQIRQRIAQVAGAILSEDALVKSRLQEQETIRVRFAEDGERLKVLLERQAEADRLAG